ncbi:nuclear envelope integral membrane protein 1-like [Haliotis rubra]|uniref:nuclear envelope integral membrane protein 1-like n=1 Tax=Haliotis rubra TaxID=36100 RepID=UPI001EE50159|nr:nuclear envelope integral membrane protein 1-like [Haliotis rubra]
MALNSSVEAVKGLLVFLFCMLTTFTVGVQSQEWSKVSEECQRAMYNGQKECYVLGQQDAKFKVEKSKNVLEDRLFVFCHQGYEKEWYRLWLNPKIRVLESELHQDFNYVYGENLTDVKEHYKSSYISLWNWWRMKEEFSFLPFNTSCLGIASSKNYTVEFKIKNPELWYVFFVVLGIVIFFYAKSWSRNVALHYGTGISVGVFASLLIVVFILNKLMPQRLKTIGYAFMLVSGSASMFILQTVSHKFNDILQNHWHLALGYILVTGLVSFAVVYRYGPVKDQRTLNLVRWTLQLVGLLFIYIGTQIPEASIAIIIIVLSVYNFPRKVVTKFTSFSLGFTISEIIKTNSIPLDCQFHMGFLVWQAGTGFSGPKIRLLTEEEFIMQGHVETEKAMEELRSFCQSPECDSWRVISRLKHPSRFAKFVEGDSHISDSELLDHDSVDYFSPPSDDISDNESETDFRLSTP